MQTKTGRKRKKEIYREIMGKDDSSMERLKWTDRWLCKARWVGPGPGTGPSSGPSSASLSAMLKPSRPFEAVVSVGDRVSQHRVIL